jgi:hypothetical protein
MKLSATTWPSTRRRRCSGSQGRAGGRDFSPVSQHFSREQVQVCTPGALTCQVVTKLLRPPARLSLPGSFGPTPNQPPHCAAVALPRAILVRYGHMLA